MITKSGQFSIGDKVVSQFGAEGQIVRFGRNGLYAFLDSGPGVAVPVAELKPAAEEETSAADPTPASSEKSTTGSENNSPETEPTLEPPTSESEAN